MDMALEVLAGSSGTGPRGDQGRLPGLSVLPAEPSAGMVSCGRGQSWA